MTWHLKSGVGGDWAVDLSVCGVRLSSFPDKASSVGACTAMLRVTEERDRLANMCDKFTGPKGYPARLCSECEAAVGSACLLCGKLDS